jgi:hypothetical protein
MSLKFTYRSAGTAEDTRADRVGTSHDRKKILLNGEPLSPNMDKDTKQALDQWALTKGFGIVSVYSDTKCGHTATWARTEPTVLPKLTT